MKGDGEDSGLDGRLGFVLVMAFLFKSLFDSADAVSSIEVGSMFLGFGFLDDLVVVLDADDIEDLAIGFEGGESVSLLVVGLDVAADEVVGDGFAAFGFGVDVVDVPAIVAVAVAIGCFVHGATGVVIGADIASIVPFPQA